jgi:integrase/recombinase XerD
LVGDLRKWLGRNGHGTPHLDEQLLEAFAEHRQQVRRGDLRTLRQFLDHLREREVVQDRKPVPDQPPLTDLLIQYEKYLRSERGLTATTISHYQYFVRKFVLERFPNGPFLAKEVKASDISAFILRRGQSQSVASAKLMTTALRGQLRSQKLVDLRQSEFNRALGPPVYHDSHVLNGNLFVCVYLLPLRPVSMDARQKAQTHESAHNWR